MKNYLKTIVTIVGILAAFTLGGLLPGCTNAADEEAAAVSITTTANAQIADMTAQASELATSTAQMEAVTETAVSLSATAQQQATMTAQAKSTAAAAAAAATAESDVTATAEAAATATSVAAESARATVQAARTATAQSEAAATAVAVSGMNALVDEAKLFAPVYGPREGELAHVDDNFIEASFANVNMRDFVVEATFAVDLAGVFAGDRDVGFQFRFQDEGAYRLVMTLNGEWELTRRDGETFIRLQEGHISDLNADGRNTMTLYAKGPTGYFFVNGRFVAELTLIHWQEMGDIGAGIEYFINHESDDGVTYFEAYTIWPLEEIVVAPAPQPQVTQAPPGFNGAALRADMDNMRLTIEQIGGLLDRLYNGETQSCAEYLGYYSALVNRATYSGLPVEWQGVYNEYIFAADNIIATNNSVRTLCEAGGGVIGELDYGVARQGIGESLNRINQAIQTANSLLGN